MDRLLFAAPPAGAHFATNCVRFNAVQLEPALRPDFATTIEGAYPLGEPQECKPHPLQLERVCTFLKSCREDLRAAGVENVKLTTLVSCIGGSTDAGRHICDFAAQNMADMVVLGSRGHSLQRSMLRLMSVGSVSEFVMRHASVPGVLVHKPSLTSPPQQQEQ